MGKVFRMIGHVVSAVAMIGITPNTFFGFYEPEIPDALNQSEE